MSFFGISSCNKNDQATKESVDKSEIKAFPTNTDMWNYLSKNQFLSEGDSTIITFKHFKAYKNGKQISEELKVDDVTSTTASLSGISSLGSTGYFIVIKDGINDGVIDMSNPDNIVQYKVYSNSNK